MITMRENVTACEYDFQKEILTMRYNPIDDPGIAAGAEKPPVENHEGEEIADKITSFSLDFTGIIETFKQFFDWLIGLFKK